MRTRSVRLSLAALLLLSVGVLAVPALASDSGGSPYALPDDGSGSFDAADEITVITGDSDSPRDGNSPRGVAEIIAVDGDGDLLYRNTTYAKYWDVDPVPGTSYTVTYAASEYLSDCKTDQLCYRDVVVRHNLSTDETEVVFSRVHTGEVGLRPHDVDVYPNGDLLVADIANDRVYRVDPETGMSNWSWDAQADFPIEGGGPYPDDWTHLNDVEVLPDGTVMVSLRNQDSVVFIDPETGLNESRTLGSDDDYSVLYEQHNPDYIPTGNRSNVSGAVVVADSQNNRVVEYEYRDGEWTRTWVWSDAAMLWPRDADRLPNGNTLVTDSNSDRVFEVAPSGEIVWRYRVAFPYEAERLGTGDESAGGEPASTLGYESVHRDGSGDGATGTIKRVLPSSAVNAVAYVKPAWLSLVQVVGVVGIVLVGVAWTCAEAYWRRPSVSFRWPVRFGE